MAEAVSLVLAVAPLIVSAGEHFSSTAEALSRYKRFSDEVDDFFAELNVQCAIFRAAVQLLLASFVGDEQAAQMLLNGQHGGWKDPSLEFYLEERFSICSSAFMDSLVLLRNRLVSLQKLSESFQHVVEDVNSDNSVPLKKKIRRIGKKINIACSKGRIERLLEAFRNRIKDFRVLVEQTEKLSERHPPGAASQLAKSKITEFTEVKAAANNLYTTFGQACTKHTEHQAYIGLQPTQWQSAQVNFILAFKQMALQSCPTSEMCEESEDMLWLTIESTIEESIQTRQLGGSFEMSNALNNTLKRDRETSPCCSPNQNKEQAHIKMLTKRVRFREDQTACGTAPPEASLSLHVPKSDSLLNLCSHKNFCNHIQRIVRQPRLPKDRCVGYLECRGNSKHMVYINSRKDTVTKTAQPTAMVTLSQLLKNGCGSMLPAGALLQDRKFKMGMQLATAVLQFHETCWLKESWSSDDIAVSDMRSTPVLPLRSETALYEPFANVSIRSQENKAVLLQDQGPVGPSYIRNRPLFNLGKILLELAFEKPFDELKEKEDLDLNVVADPDYFAAWKLQREVSAKLGIRYSEIVRKCINCDFGQGDDFTQERLQASFYQHVICELETCEQQALGRA